MLQKLIFHHFLEEDETVLRVFRVPFHFCLLRIGKWFVLTLLLAGFVFYFVTGMVNEWVLTVLFLGFGRMMASFAHWYVNGIVMTTEGLIIVDWNAPFQKKYHRIDYTSLHEITVEKLGVRAFMMNYGDLTFHKGGGHAYTVKQIAAPGRSARIIENQREATVSKKNFHEESTLKGLLSSMVQKKLGDGDMSVENPNKAYAVWKHEAKEGDLAPAKPETTSPKRKPRFEDMSTEIEKRLDDTGGIEIDLEER